MHNQMNTFYYSVILTFAGHLCGCCNKINDKTVTVEYADRGLYYSSNGIQSSNISDLIGGLHKPNSVNVVINTKLTSESIMKIREEINSLGITEVKISCNASSFRFDSVGGDEAITRSDMLQ